MSVTLPSIIHPQSTWITIPLGGEQSFEIEVRRPTFAEQVAVLLATDEVSHIEQRIQASVVNWRGVVATDGTGLPFSWTMLCVLMSVYPQALRHIQGAVLDVWVTYPEDLAKNLPLPPDNGGTTTTDAITSGTEPSNSPAPSSDGSGSEPSTVT